MRTSMPSRSLRIGELAESIGLSARTIRFYESQRVLPEPQRSSAGYRTYGERDVERLRFLLRAKGLGLSLPEIREIIALRDGGEEPCDHVRSLLDEKIARVTSQIVALQEMEQELTTLRNARTRDAANAGCYCSIIEHEGHCVEV